MYQANTGGTGSNGGGGHSSGGGGHTSILGRTNSVYNRNTSSLGKKILWGKKPLDEGHSSSSVNDLKQPKSSLNRSSSAFISKVTTCDNLHKKLNQANELIIAAHGRFFNILNSNDDYTKIEAENPYIRVLFNIGIITSIACFIHSFPHDKNLDIAIAFSTGDLVWINPFKMKYTRFNKNAKLLNKPIISVRWSNCGRYILAGFSNGEVMVFNRDLEEDENYFISQDLARREPHAVFYKESTLATKLNPISHFKISNKPITSIKINPVYNNFCCITSDDGFIRIIDLSKNFLSDIYESYYGGILVSEFTKDGKFLLVGGEDDFISIYELLINNISNVPINGNLRLITRLQGQSSWVRSIKVDYVKSSPKVAVYRIGGVGDDGYLNYWEFQPRRLPKIKRPLHHHNRTGSRNISGNYAPSSHNTTPNLKSGSNGTFPSQKQSQQQQQSHRRRISSLPLANLYRHSNSISSLTSSTTQQHMSLIEAIHSNSQAATSGDGYSSSSNNNNNLSSNSLIPETALSFTSNTVTWIPINLEMNKCVVHNAAGYNAVPILQPLSSKDVSLGRLSGLFFDKNYSWVFSAGGDLVRWKRP
ncbi:hypothetical protein PACTADRAFT_2199 [Pachysolen tannophilus NRRL Y-2460]|uniref:Uncharacterized protein n=1 Tax=Pachysolen tannophilus NRRL Y-2460 TaxID=669874 RepID=A0A1E4TVW6_PACTA|nr:hypothetical protein PACTADRAFT_2199 [Pachysolen tannophilus NRRL Y-2460]